MNGLEEGEENANEGINNENEEPRKEVSSAVVAVAGAGSVHSTPAKRSSGPNSEQICSDNEVSFVNTNHLT